MSLERAGEEDASPATSPVVLVPRCVRYIDEEYVDRFLSDGTLRLTSFQRCAKYEDEKRKDMHEGWQTLDITSGTSRQPLVGIAIPEPSFYLLCCSVAASAELQKLFEVNSGFVITDPLRFSVAVSQSLAECVRAIQGSCFYEEMRVTRAHFLEPLVTQLPETEVESEAMAEKFEEYIRRADAGSSIFRKPLNYSEQHEYRFVWQIGGTASDYVTVTCREAAKYCEKLPSF